MKNILIFGSTGAIGSALIKHYATRFPEATIHAVSRSENQSSFTNVIGHTLNYSDESAIEALAKKLQEHGTFETIIVSIGTLHDGERQPEKSISQLSFDNLEQVFAINTFIPAMLAKYFTPLLTKGKKSVFAVLSARVGSISDNRLGGWYAYRASKSALNMIIKTCAIETSRRNRNSVIIGVHPGTVDSNLSKPFQGNVPEGKLFTPEFCAERLATVIGEVSSDDTGKCFAWDGQEVLP